MAFAGKLPPWPVMVQFEILSPTFPVVVPVLKKMVPNVAAVLEPAIVQFVTVSLDASLMNRIVLGVAATAVLTMKSEFDAELRPSIVTLSAPLRSINGPAMEPVMERVPTGLIVTLVYEAEPLPLAFNTADAVSVVSSTTETLTAPVWMPALMASNASFNVG